ncbi:MAG TPA: DUF4230 domain-containing protein [Ilumatobacteraceae bacterium]|nr:DUF4230 domain-containing protein [Ilumatobacteraceae bacterium]
MATTTIRKGGRIRSFFVGTAALIGAGAVVLAVLGQFFTLPFTTTERDHSAPPVLLELRNLADFHAAQARFEVTIDKEDDVAWVPSFVAGERVQYIAVGTVDGIVDFTGLSSTAVEVSDDGTSVVISLPAPYLADPVIDTETSHVMNRDRGLVNRVAGVFTDNPTSEHGLVLMAQDKLAEAAQSTDLLQRTEDNTRSMLVAMLKSLGFDHVEVGFEASWAHTTSVSEFDGVTTTTSA